MVVGVGGSKYDTSVILKLDPEEASRPMFKSDIIHLQRRIKGADDLARTGTP